MATSIRNLVNRESGIAQKPPEWWKSEVRALLLMDTGVVVAALRHVPEARDCPQIGLAHGQCVKVADDQNPILAIMDTMRERMAVLHGCNLYVDLCPSSKLMRLCAIAGIKKICYVNGSPSGDELEVPKAYGMEVIHVSI